MAKPALIRKRPGLYAGQWGILDFCFDMGIDG